MVWCVDSAETVLVDGVVWLPVAMMQDTMVFRSSWAMGFGSPARMLLAGRRITDGGNDDDDNKDQFKTVEGVRVWDRAVPLGCCWPAAASLMVVVMMMVVMIVIVVER